MKQTPAPPAHTLGRAHTPFIQEIFVKVRSSLAGTMGEGQSEGEAVTANFRDTAGDVPSGLGASGAILGTRGG